MDKDRYRFRDNYIDGLAERIKKRGRDKKLTEADVCWAIGNAIDETFPTDSSGL